MHIHIEHSFTMACSMKGAVAVVVEAVDATLMAAAAEAGVEITAAASVYAVVAVAKTSAAAFCASAPAAGQRLVNFMPFNTANHPSLLPLSGPGRALAATAIGKGLTATFVHAWKG
jgi:hypothetical protein